MKSASYTVTAKVWLYPGDAPWHFVTIKKSDADEIKKEVRTREKIKAGETIDVSLEAVT